MHFKTFIGCFNEVNGSWNKGFKHEATKKMQKIYLKNLISLYSFFWGLNLKLIDMGEVKKIDENQINKKDTDKTDYGEIGKSCSDCD